MSWLTGKGIIFALALLSLFFIMGLFCFYYRAEYITTLKAVNTKQAIIEDMKRREKEIAELDKKYLQEIQHAQENISQLRHDVSAGKRRLQLAATCPDVAASSASVDDAARPGLNDAAKRDYFTLRKRIEISRMQIAGLQAYINEQCMK